MNTHTLLKSVCAQLMNNFKIRVTVKAEIVGNYIVIEKIFF